LSGWPSETDSEVKRYSFIVCLENKKLINMEK